MLLASTSLLWNCLENIPSEQMPSVRKKMNLRPGLYTLCTHFPISSKSICKRKQQMSTGDLTVALFWETLNTH